MPGIGAATKISLRDTLPLFDWAGNAATAMTRESACLSLELAYTAYTMSLNPWQDAGWTDFSLLADQELVTGDALNGQDNALGDLARGVMQTLTRLHVTMRDPVTQYLGLRRQKDENAPACKAVVMLRRSYGYYVVGIAFMGTGKRLFDWLPNLRIQPENGFHSGFWQLTEQFLARAGDIEFRQTAREIGAEKLTLRDILSELRADSSRFRLWVCGHSQGAAVTQILVDRLAQEGVPAERMLGYGFASPCVAQQAVPRFAGLPVYHILNEDDMMTRMGGSAHIGRCWTCCPGEAERSVWYAAQGASPCFREALAYAGQGRDTESGLLMILGALRVMSEQSADVVRRFFGGTEGTPFRDLLRPGEEWTVSLLDRLTKAAADQYLAMTERSDLPEDRLTVIQNKYHGMIARYGLNTWMQAMMNTVTLPHKLSRNVDAGERIAPYQWIVTYGMDRLREALPAGQTDPCLRPADRQPCIPRTGGETAPRDASVRRPLVLRPTIRLPKAKPDDSPAPVPAEPDQDGVSGEPGQKAGAQPRRPSRYGATLRLLAAARLANKPPFKRN